MEGKAGMIKKVKLQDLCNQITDGTHFTPTYVSSGIPFLRVTDITESNESKKFISRDEHLELIKRCNPQKGDILYTKNGTIGVAKKVDWDYEFSIFVSLCLLKIKEELIDKDYLVYYLNTEFALKQALSHTKTATISNLHLVEIKQIQIPLPPLETQQKIAAILDAADAYRQKTKALVDKYDQLAQSLFLDMFGDPVRNEKGWERIKFSKAAKNENFRRIPVKQEDRDKRDGIYPYYGATGIIDTIDDYKFDGEYLLIAEDGKNLMFRKKNNAFRATGKFWVNNHAHVLSANESFMLSFLEYFLNCIDFKPYLSGIDQVKLNRENLDNIPVPHPPIHLQNQFAERIQQIEAQKQQAQTSLQKAETLFNSLLHQAFNGGLVN